MSWKESAVIERPAPQGGAAARLEPVDTVTWGPGKAEWTFTFYALTLDGQALEGLFTSDLVWAEQGQQLAAVQCLNPVQGSDYWNYVDPDWQPQQALLVIDLERRAIGRAAAQADCFYKPTAFEPDSIVYEKRKHFALGPVWEMEVALSAIENWQAF